MAPLTNLTGIMLRSSIVAGVALVGALFGGSAPLLLLGGLAMGGWRHYQAELDVAATAQQSRTLVPDVRVATVRAAGSKITVTSLNNRLMPRQAGQGGSGDSTRSMLSAATEGFQYVLPRSFFD